MLEIQVLPTWEAQDAEWNECDISLQPKSVRELVHIAFAPAPIGRLAASTRIACNVHGAVASFSSTWWSDCSVASQERSATPLSRGSIAVPVLRDGADGGLNLKQSVVWRPGDTTG